MQGKLPILLLAKNLPLMLEINHLKDSLVTVHFQNSRES